MTSAVALSDQRRWSGAATRFVADDAERLGSLLAASGFFTDAREGAQAAVKVMAGAEIGFGPVASMTGVYIVKGRVTLSANLMAAAIKRAPQYTYRLAEHDEQHAVIEFYEQGELIGTSAYTMADATKAGLAGGENWRKHPKNMLFARAMSNGAKWYCPDVFGGPVYTPDELGATTDAEGDIIDVGPHDAAQPGPAEHPPMLAPAPVAPPAASSADAAPASTPVTEPQTAPVPAAPEPGEQPLAVEPPKATGATDGARTPTATMLATGKVTENGLRLLLMGEFGIDDARDLDAALQALSEDDLQRLVGMVEGGRA